MFKRSEEHARFFKELSKDKRVFQMEFDLWYLCFLVGVTKGRREGLTKAVDMIGYFPGRYSAQEGVLLAMLLRAELSAKGVGLEDRTAVQSVVDHLIDPATRPPLTSAGFRAFNEYAAGGYEILREKLMGEPPREPSTFLVSYSEVMNQTVDEARY